MVTGHPVATGFHHGHLSFSKQSWREPHLLFCTVVNGGIIRTWSKYLDDHSHARDRKAIRHFFFTVRKCTSALLHRKPTLIIMHTSKTRKEMQLYTFFFHCTALLWLRHELLGSDYPVLSLCWLISSAVIAQNIMKLSCQRAFKNKYIKSQIIVLYCHFREWH